jgi:hypothetical protein
MLCDEHATAIRIRSRISNPGAQTQRRRAEKSSDILPEITDQMDRASEDRPPVVAFSLKAA